MQLNQFNLSFHIVTKKEHFQINALFKLLYLRITELEKRWKAGHIQNWSMILNQLMMNELFAFRIEKSLKKIWVCQEKCVSFKIILSSSVNNCWILCLSSILFVLEYTCLHLVIHGKLITHKRPVCYGTSIPFLIQFSDSQIECLTYSCFIRKCSFFGHFSQA